MTNTSRQLISSGTPWEKIVGYSRAVRVRLASLVSGTTASDENGVVQGVGDPYAQALYILQKIERALEQAGATMRDVVRTRVYVINVDHWQEVGKAHAAFFADVRPANTLVEISKLVNPDHLVEIEIDAVIGSASTP